MNSQYFAYLCDRVQKITEAVYRVTDLLPEKEPLKWEIREKSVNIFTDFVCLGDKKCFEEKDCFDRIDSAVVKLVALLSLLSKSANVSGINFEILKEEYESVKKVIDKEKQSEPDILSQLFSESNLGLTAPKPQGVSIGQSNGQHNGQKSIGYNKSRKEQILNIVKEKKQVTVGELAARFSQYSEKTIQRDLLEMVNNGLLSKEGDKRWRKYTLIN